MTTNPTQDAIAAAYLNTATNQDWIRLADLRPMIQGDPATVTAELLAMTRTGLVHLAPSSNRQALTDADRAAAVKIGDQDKHLIAIEDDYFTD